MKRTTDVHTAIRIAKETVDDLFGVPGRSRLEEVDFDDFSYWKITVSFSRSLVAGVMSGVDAQRTFKVVRIRDSDGHVASVTHRTFPSED